MKEKLIELCEDVILSCKSSLCDDCEHNCIDYPSCMGVHFADHLIANGVTVLDCPRDCANCWKTQLLAPNWISVKDRLPEEDKRVLVWVGENDKSFPVIDTDRVHKGRWVRWEEYITHWMPLPQPPKGE